MAVNGLTEFVRMLPTTEVVGCVMVGLLIAGSLLGAVISSLSQQRERLRRQAHRSHGVSRMMDRLRIGA